MKNKIIVLIVAALVLVGCASTGNQKLGKMQTHELNQTIVEGKTTKAQIKQVLGDPSVVDIDNFGNEKWTYTHSKSQVKPENFIPVFSLFVSGTNDKSKSLVILFDKNNVVKKHVYSEAKGETKTGLLG